MAESQEHDDPSLIHLHSGTNLFVALGPPRGDGASRGANGQGRPSLTSAAFCKLNTSPAGEPW